MNRAETLLVGGCARALPIQLPTYIRVKQSARFGQVNVNNGGRYCVSGAGQAQTNSSAASFTQLLPPLSISMLFHSFFFCFLVNIFLFSFGKCSEKFLDLCFGHSCMCSRGLRLGPTLGTTNRRRACLAAINQTSQAT